MSFSLFPFTLRRSIPSSIALLASIGGVFVPALVLPARAASIAVPNFSFESPSANTPGFPVNVDLDNWTDTPQRAGYSSPIPWGFGTGSFPNPAVGQTNRLTNMNGDRAAFILASVELGFYQELTAPGSIFSIGQSYQLTVGLSAQAGTPGGSANDNSGGGPVVPVDGSTVLSLSLYYTVGGVITLIPGATTPVPAFPDTNTFI